jgi:NAD(P)-dependent dehydrogenase (short-subunit alcohol dehydrogenase family)
MSYSKYTSTILITGGTQGLGYHTALSLASSHPTTLIILASRTDPSSSAATINSKLQQSNTIYLPLDLSSLASVRSFATTYHASSYPPLSTLVLNAGAQFPGALEFTNDGIEKHFAINHVGHALLFHLLVPCLTSDARILVVTSGLHDPEQGKRWGTIARYTSAEKVARGECKESNGRERYATSKTANVLWTFGLARHLNTQHQGGYTVLAFDPGLMFNTGLTREAHWFVRFLAKWVMPPLTGLFSRFVNDNVNTPKESGANLAWLVEGKEVKGLKGIYFEKRKEREAGVVARDVEVQEDLWKWTVERVGTSKEERERFARVE